MLALTEVPVYGRVEEFAITGIMFTISLSRLSGRILYKSRASVTLYHGRVDR